MSKINPRDQSKIYLSTPPLQLSDPSLENTFLATWKGWFIQIEACPQSVMVLLLQVGDSEENRPTWKLKLYTKMPIVGEAQRGNSKSYFHP